MPGCLYKTVAEINEQTMQRGGPYEARLFPIGPLIDLLFAAAISGRLCDVIILGISGVTDFGMAAR